MTDNITIETKKNLHLADRAQALAKSKVKTKFCFFVHPVHVETDDERKSPDQNRLFNFRKTGDVTVPGWASISIVQYCSLFLA